MSLAFKTAVSSGFDGVTSTSGAGSSACCNWLLDAKVWPSFSTFALPEVQTRRPSSALGYQTLLIFQKACSLASTTAYCWGCTSFLLQQTCLCSPECYFPSSFWTGGASWLQLFCSDHQTTLCRQSQSIASNTILVKLLHACSESPGSVGRHWANPLRRCSLSYPSSPLYHSARHSFCRDYLCRWVLKVSLGLDFNSMFQVCQML